MSPDQNSTAICTSLYVPSELPNIVGQSVIFASCLVLLLCVYNEQSFKKRPWLLNVYAFFIVLTLESVDVSMVIWQSRPARHESVINPTNPQTAKVSGITLPSTRYLRKVMQINNSTLHLKILSILYII